MWIQKKAIIKYEENDDILYKLAKINGIENLSEWLRPSEKSLHDPYLLDNIEEAGARIVKALRTGQKIDIFYDIDCDGICAGTMMYQYLKNYTTNLEILFIQRSEGHGIENYIKKNHIETDLLIIVDSSTNSAEACKKITEQGIDIVIIDHHLKEKPNPYVTLVNNNTCKYPNKHLSGSAVVYKVLEVLDDLLEENMAFDYIDLAGLGLYGDVMSVREPENRYFIYQSLKNIQNMGLKYLFKESKVGTINSETYGFKVVPIINASARMDMIEKVIELLITEEPEACSKLAKECIKLNETRKDIQAEVYAKVKDGIDDSHKIVVVVTEESSKGFNGLIATNIASEYKKPVLVVRNKNGFCEGSARGYGSLAFKKFLDSTKLMTYTAGHQGSFGVGFSINNLEQILKYADKYIDDAQFEAEDIYYDLELKPDQITDSLISNVVYFNFITGNGFPATRFLVRGLFVENRDLLGQGIIKETVKLETDCDLTLMKFKTTEDYAEDAELCTIDVVGTLNINKWYNFGKKQQIIVNQMFLDDWRFSN